MKWMSWKPCCKAPTLWVLLRMFLIITGWGIRRETHTAEAYWNSIEENGGDHQHMDLCMTVSDIKTNSMLSHKDVFRILLVHEIAYAQSLEPCTAAEHPRSPVITGDLCYQHCEEAVMGGGQPGCLLLQGFFTLQHSEPRPLTALNLQYQSCGRLQTLPLAKHRKVKQTLSVSFTQADDCMKNSHTVIRYTNIDCSHINCKIKVTYCIKLDYFHV